jgi:hypothetical protein
MKSLTTLIALLIATAAHAKVASVEIVEITSRDGVPYAYRDLTAVIASPLKMESLVGNPIVTYRVYLAPGVETDTSKFTFVNANGSRFAGSETSNGEVFGWRLDTSKYGVSFGNALHDRSPGIYSVYITADDGDGECRPSGIVTFELIPWAYEVFAKPSVSGARSPAAGMVVLHLDPVVYTGKGEPPPLISVYRADGRTTDSLAFTPIMSRFRAPQMFNDTAFESRSRVLEIAIVGLKNGLQSFQVQVQLERGSYAKGIRSTIMSVDVQGAETPDLQPFIFFNFIAPVSSFPDAPAPPRFLMLR